VRRANLAAGAITTAGWLVYALSFVGAVVFATVRAVNGDSTAGEVLLVVAIGRASTTQISMLAQGYANLATITRTIRRFLWLEDYSKQTTVDPARRRPVPVRLHHGITLEHVTFRYHDTESPALLDANLHLPAGATIALVGENGAGKTTLVKLLGAMYRPTEGRILVDDDDLADYDVEEWRGRLAATFQDFSRYELVARQTVGVGDLPRLDEITAIETALERANGTDVIAGLDEGLDTRLGRSFEGGRELSGGQWQKLALGRGMMRDEPLLLLLDEPTASLDAATEHALFERYADASRRAGRGTGAITLLVSHRFSTVQMADLIVVLDRADILEVGSHDELVRAGGRYAELYELQARAYR
jgi:ATP-binding cassette subfamily B protein